MTICVSRPQADSSTGHAKTWLSSNSLTNNSESYNFFGSNYASIVEANSGKVYSWSDVVCGNGRPKTTGVWIPPTQ